MKPETLKWMIGTAFATFVFGAGFYGIVLYEYALDDLTKGALISLMTLAAQFVFGEALASAVGRRQQAAYDSGVQTPTTQVDVANVETANVGRSAPPGRGQP